MALDPHEILQGSSSFEDIAAPPPLAGTRRKRLQRLQIGLIGLGAVFLLLSLKVATVAMVCSLPLGIAVAWLLARSSRSSAPAS